MSYLRDKIKAQFGWIDKEINEEIEAIAQMVEADNFPTEYESTDLGYKITHRQLVAAIRARKRT